MLKRIHVDQLHLGMHLKEFCGSWMDHPFWRTGFVIKDPKDIDLILASNIREVWIDCSKGSDVPPGEPVVSEEELPPAPIKPVDAPKRVKSRQETAPRPTSQEIERAARICQLSRSAVVSMFEEVRMGKAVDVNSVREVVEDISDSIARNPTAIVSLARLKTADDYTYMHSVAVCALMVALSGKLGLDEVQTRSSGIAGLLHDLGKVAMPTEVLNKPGKLTVAEFDIMKTHPTEGYKMLMEIRSACMPGWAQCAMSMMPLPPIAPTSRVGTRLRLCIKWHSGPTAILIPKCFRLSSEGWESTRWGLWCDWHRGALAW